MHCLRIYTHDVKMFHLNFEPTFINLPHYYNFIIVYPCVEWHDLLFSFVCPVFSLWFLPGLPLYSHDPPNFYSLIVFMVLPNNHQVTILPDVNGIASVTTDLVRTNTRSHQHPHLLHGFCCAPTHVLPHCCAPYSCVVALLCAVLMCCRTVVRRTHVLPHCCVGLESRAAPAALGGQIQRNDRGIHRGEGDMCA